jgi:hypothetical protein
MFTVEVDAEVARVAMSYFNVPPPLPAATAAGVAVSGGDAADSAAGNGVGNGATCAATPVSGDSGADVTPQRKYANACAMLKMHTRADALGR